MTDKKQKYSQPMMSRRAMPAARHASAVTRIHTSSPGLTRLSTTPAPSASRRRWTIPSRSPSPGSANVSVSVEPVSLNGTTTDHDRLASGDVLDHRLGAFAAPPRAHVLVLDPLLQQHDALEQRLGTGRTPGHVDVDRNDLVDTFGDRVAVPVRPAAVGARTHRDDVLRIRHL